MLVILAIDWAMLLALLVLATAGWGLGWATAAALV
jgi:hypothetical protein